MKHYEYLIRFISGREERIRVDFNLVDKLKNNKGVAHWLDTGTGIIIYISNIEEIICLSETE